jgi:uncharacterized protein (DUF934 family)
MSCEHVRDQLSAYLDNMLASEDQQSVALHLELCAGCTQLLNDFRRFDTLIAQLPRVLPGSSYSTVSLLLDSIGHLLHRLEGKDL